MIRCGRLVLLRGAQPTLLGDDTVGGVRRNRFVLETQSMSHLTNWLRARSSSMGQTAHTWIGLFDLFRIGVGPSSSHTVGPMVAAASFANGLRKDFPVERLRVELFGSLAWTGKGHATDVAIMLGLTGAQPDTIDPDEGASIADGIRRLQRLSLPDGRRVPFDSASDIVFLPREALPRHSNALRFAAIAAGQPDV